MLDACAIKFIVLPFIFTSSTPTPFSIRLDPDLNHFFISDRERAFDSPCNADLYMLLLFCFGRARHSPPPFFYLPSDSDRPCLLRLGGFAVFFYLVHLELKHDTKWFVGVSRSLLSPSSCYYHVAVFVSPSSPLLLGGVFLPPNRQL